MFWVAGLKPLITKDANFVVEPDFYVNTIEQKAKALFNLKLLNYKIEVLGVFFCLGGQGKYDVKSVFPSPSFKLNFWNSTLGCWLEL